MAKIKFGILGCGRSAEIIYKAMTMGLLDEYELVGIYSRTFEKTKILADKTLCKACRSMEELLALKPEYVVEVASPEAMKTHCIDILNAKSNIICLSMGAFADEGFYQKARETALKNCVKIHIASGAIGGFDLMRTLSLMGAKTSIMTNYKCSEAVERAGFLSGDELKNPQTVFDGSAKEAIEKLPTGINIGVATAMATLGADKTRIIIKNAPDIEGDEIHILVGDKEDKDNMELISRVSSGTLYSWSIVALMRNLVSPIMF